jgi:hypothetical protein
MAMLAENSAMGFKHPMHGARGLFPRAAEKNFGALRRSRFDFHRTGWNKPAALVL